MPKILRFKWFWKCGHIIVRLIVANKLVDFFTTHFNKATITVSLQRGDHLHPSPCLLQASQEDANSECHLETWVDEISVWITT